MRVERDVKNTRWSPVRFLERVRGVDYWLMRCLCGTERRVSYKNYKRGRSLSCGCYNREVTAGREPSHKLPTGESALNHLYLVYKRGALKRGLTFTLTKEDVKILTSRPCTYCGAQPTQVIDRTKYGAAGVYTYNGIDRLDNDGGYVLNNCAPCCKPCNYAKGTRDRSEFLTWLEALTDYRMMQRGKKQ